MEKYLTDRLEGLRQRWHETKDQEWLNRFEECKHILEVFVIQQMEKETKDDYRKKISG